MHLNRVTLISFIANDDEKKVADHAVIARQMIAPLYAVSSGLQHSHIFSTITIV